MKVEPMAGIAPADDGGRRGGNRMLSLRSGATSGRPDTLGVHAYRTIREAIRVGGIVPNRRYSENELATSMGMSRTPVREALIELAREGLVEIKPQRGFQLRTLSDSEATEVFELRNMLEAYVVRRLAKQATKKDIEELRGILQQQRDAIDDIDEFLAHDEAFHLAMPRIVGLWRTQEMLFGLRGAMWVMGTQALGLASRTRAALAEHESILDAVEKRDPKGAVAAMSRHIHMTGDAVEQMRAEASEEE